MKLHPPVTNEFRAETFATLGAEMVTHGESKLLNIRVFKAFFGTYPEVVADIWGTADKPKKTHPNHLLWTLMFLKLYVSEDVICIICQTSKNTLRKWVWLWIDTIALTSLSVIDWNKRKRNAPDDVWCLASVDGTDFEIEEPYPFNRKWMSHKFKSAALKYEVAVSIYSGDIVWIYGPHRGAKHDLTIFRSKLKQMLGPLEMVEADNGYRGEAEFIRIRDDSLSKKESIEKDIVRARHETVNGRFKAFGILKQAHRHSRQKHELVFRSVATIVQLEIDNGHCLFGCEPTTKRQDRYELV